MNEPHLTSRPMLGLITGAAHPAYRQSFKLRRGGGILE
jgi:hypothetical protein